MRLIRVVCQLYTLDREWDDKARTYQAIVQRLNNQSELKAAREAQRLRHEELSTTRSALQDAELELDGLTQKVAEVDKALYGGRVISPRELDGLRQDAEHLKERVSELEDRALEAMAEVDRLQVAASEGQAELRSFEARWTKENEELTAQYKVLRERLQELQKQREELRASLDASVLSLYDELRTKKAGAALAPIKGGVCQVCHVTAPSYKARSVEKGDGLITCEGCGRILYPE